MGFNVFKIEYDWYEGEHEESLLGKNIEREEFEKDLKEAKKFAVRLIGKKIIDHNYLGKGYNVECLPEFYRQIIWFLKNKKSYIECNFDEDITYEVDDTSGKDKITLTRSEKSVSKKELGSD